MELLKENNHQRFYKVDFDVNICDFHGKLYKTEELFDIAYGKKLKEGSNKNKILKESKRIICISDATTHIERLAFLGTKEKESYKRLRFAIAGKNTIMIKGGNIDKVYDDKVYIEYLRKINQDSK
jgi:hypothetical protein